MQVLLKSFLFLRFFEHEFLTLFFVFLLTVELNIQFCFIIIRHKRIWEKWKIFVWALKYVVYVRFKLKFSGWKWWKRKEKNHCKLHSNNISHSHIIVKYTVYNEENIAFSSERHIQYFDLWLGTWYYLQFTFMEFKYVFDCSNANPTRFLYNDLEYVEESLIYIHVLWREA